jgi:dolichol-phosphate mannosyltransferase
MLAMADLVPGRHLSVVAPAHNEEDNVQRLVDEVVAALAPTRLDFEFIIVDDGSTDGTRHAVQALMARHAWLRCLAMAQTPPGRGHGQSAAFHAGFRACRGELIATLDADCQNDPADLPRMLDLLERTRADMVQGDRSRNRRDSAVRRGGSVVGRTFRRGLLGDTIRDTGCSLRVMRRQIALRLPLELRGMHRFIPMTARQMGYTVVEMPVSHRPRTAGETKYGMGIASRAIPGLVDCFAVRYMGKRRRPVLCEVIEAIEAEVGAEAGAEAKSEGAGRAPGAIEVEAIDAPGPAR